MFNALHVNIASVRLWDEARTPQQLASKWDRLLIGDEPTLIADWRLNDGWLNSKNERPNRTMQDHSPNNKHGAIVEH